MTRVGPIYLDNFATTQIAPESVAAIIDAWSLPGNASSPHSMGARAEAIIEKAKCQIAGLIGAAPSEIFFTSGATEANNLALLGLPRASANRGLSRTKVIVSEIEHKSVLVAADHLVKEGFDLIRIPANKDGVVDKKALFEALDEKTILVSVMGANNETGVLQPIKEIVDAAHTVGAFVHSDCAQLIGKCEIDVAELEVDYVSISGHKIYGPMGIGALYISASALRPAPITFGGGHQSGIRSGTEPVPLISGFGAAASLANASIDHDRRHANYLRSAFLSRLSDLDEGFEVITNDAAVLPGSVCLRVKGIVADELVDAVKRDISLSTGSACNSGQVLPSHVLVGMGLSYVVSTEIFRIYFGRYNTFEEAISAANILAAAAGGIRARTGQLRQSDVKMGA